MVLLLGLVIHLSSFVAVATRCPVLSESVMYCHPVMCPHNEGICSLHLTHTGEKQLFERLRVGVLLKDTATYVHMAGNRTCNFLATPLLIQCRPILFSLVYIP